jgi:hypothetical protein
LLRTGLKRLSSSVLAATAALMLAIGIATLGGGTAMADTNPSSTSYCFSSGAGCDPNACPSNLTCYLVILYQNGQPVAYSCPCA